MNYENTAIKRQLLDEICASRRILIFRHFRPDGDAVGSSKGLAALLKASFPEKEIYLQNNDFAEYLTFMGEEDAPLPDEMYADALGIVVDTGVTSRISNPRFSLCPKIVKIDHHIDDQPYGDLSWVEDTRSSTCEMIADFYATFRDRLVMTPEAAAFLYTGMVTDSGRFRFAETSGETLRMAALLLDQGIDTETLFANLYLKELDILHFNAQMIRRIRQTENGVSYFRISRKFRESLGISTEAAANAVSLMDSIKGSMIWIAFIDLEDGSIRVRIRSRFINIQPLASHFHGGGHENASGGTCYSTKEVKALLAEADALLAAYKATHEGWL